MIFVSDFTFVCQMNFIKSLFKPEFDGHPSSVRTPSTSLKVEISSSEVCLVSDLWVIVCLSLA